MGGLTHSNTHPYLFLCLSIRKYIKSHRFTLIFLTQFQRHAALISSLFFWQWETRLSLFRTHFLFCRILVYIYLLNGVQYMSVAVCYSIKYCFPKLLGLVFLFLMFFRRIILFTCNTGLFAILCMPLWVSPIYPGWFGLFVYWVCEILPWFWELRLYKKIYSPALGIVSIFNFSQFSWVLAIACCDFEFAFLWGQLRSIGFWPFDSLLGHSIVSFLCEMPI